MWQQMSMQQKVIPGISNFARIIIRRKARQHAVSKWAN